MDRLIHMQGVQILLQSWQYVCTCVCVEWLVGRGHVCVRERESERERERISRNEGLTDKPTDIHIKLSQQ